MIAKWVIVGLMVVSSVGKERKPTTPGSAAFTTALNAALIVAIVIWRRS